MNQTSFNLDTDATFRISKYFSYFNERPWKLGTPLQATTRNVSRFHSQALWALQVERQSKAISVNLSMSFKRYLLLVSCFWDTSLEKYVIKTDWEHKTVNGFTKMRWVPFVSRHSWVSRATKSPLWEHSSYIQCSHASMNSDDLHESQGLETVLAITHHSQVINRRDLILLIFSHQAWNLWWAACQSKMLHSINTHQWSAPK